MNRKWFVFRLPHSTFTECNETACGRWILMRICAPDLLSWLAGEPTSAAKRFVPRKTPEMMMPQRDDAATIQLISNSDSAVTGRDPVRMSRRPASARSLSSGGYFALREASVDSQSLTVDIVSFASPETTRSAAGSSSLRSAETVGIGITRCS